MWCYYGKMKATSVTIGVPVSDLAVAQAWYSRVFAVQPDIEPVPGIVEYQIAGTWVQLMDGHKGVPGWVLRVGVEDLDAERDRIRDLGIEVSETATVPGVISYFDLHDPDGNQLSVYRVLVSDSSP